VEPFLLLFPSKEVEARFLLFPLDGAAPRELPFGRFSPLSHVRTGFNGTGDDLLPLPAFPFLSENRVSGSQALLPLLVARSRSFFFCNVQLDSIVSSSPPFYSSRQPGRPRSPPPPASAVREFSPLDVLHRTPRATSFPS